MKNNLIATLIRKTQDQTLVWVRLSSVLHTLQGDVALSTWLRNYFLHLQSFRFIPTHPGTYIAKDENEDCIVILSQSKYSGKLRLDYMSYNSDSTSVWDVAPTTSFELSRLQRMIERAGIADEDEYISDILYTATDDIVV